MKPKWTVLAAKYSESHGFEFVTWKQNADGRAVFWGDYSPSYEYAKESFAVRSGLIPESRLFSEQETANLCRCVDFAKSNCETLTYGQDLSFNLNRYPLIRDIGDMGKIGREYLLTVKGCVPAHDEDDPKYAQLGRQLIQSGITAIIRNRENTLKGLFGNLILTELNHFFYTFSLTSIVTLQKRRAIF